MKRKNGNPSLRSVTRIRDVRHPGISIRITELKRDGPLFAARQVNGRPRYQKLAPERTWISLGSTNKERVAEAEALGLDLIERIATESDAEEPSSPDLTLGGLIKRYETDGLHGRTPRYRNGMLSSIKRVRDYLGADLAVKDLKPSHVQKWMAHRKADGVVVGRVAAVKAVIAARATFNARFEQHEALRAEDAALADHFGLATSDLERTAAPGFREDAVGATAKGLYGDLIERTTKFHPQVERDETGWRERRTYGEIAGSPGHELIVKAGLPEFPALTEQQRERLAEREQAQVRAREVLEQLPKMPDNVLPGGYSL